MSEKSEFTVSPGRVKAGDRIYVSGPVGAVSTIWIKETRLTAFGGAPHGDVGAIVTAAVPEGGWEVHVADPDGNKTYVGAVLVDRA